MAATSKKKLPPCYVGMSVSKSMVEAAVLQPSKDVGVSPHTIVRSVMLPLPDGVLSPSGDEVLDSQTLSSVMSAALSEVKAKSRQVHLCIPATLLRVTEMPIMQPKELYLSLTSEAERYKTFDETESVVDFSLQDNPPPAPGQSRVVFNAVRGDTLAAYKMACVKAKIKIASIDIEPMHVLRGMAGSGVLDSLVTQIGQAAFWGTLFVEPERIRLALWQGNILYELREVQMDTREFALADPNTMAANDLFDEIQRTIKTNVPSIWLTYRMPAAMDQVLAQRFNVPVRAAMIGPGVAADKPTLQVSTVGASLRNLVEFPFDFDINSSGKLYAAPKQASPGQTDAVVGLMTVLGGIGMLLSLLAWGGLALFTQFALTPQLTEKQTQVDSITAEISSVQSQIDQISGTADYYSFAKEVLNKTKARNQAFVEFIADLRRKTPPALWVYQVKLNDKDMVIFQGKTTDHQSVLNLAKSFDEVRYANTIRVRYIAEDKIGATPVFRFVITGSIKADPSIMNVEETKAPLDPLAKPDGKSTEKSTETNNGKPAELPIPTVPGA
jgi:Tfp pilus assembly PilM family ATPase